MLHETNTVSVDCTSIADVTVGEFSFAAKIVCKLVQGHDRAKCLCPSYRQLHYVE